ncbi:DNA-binding protein HU, partial [Pimelobacter simplex]|nr:DNA-binding protein HU [Pimelobacter simplex]
MNRNQLIDHVARTTGLEVTSATEAVVAVLDGIAGAVAAGEQVTLAGFGTFEARGRA